VACGEDGTWYLRQADWQGFDQFHFKIADRGAYIVEPKTPLAGKPWIWRARFPGYHAEMDIALVDQGFHIAYVDVAGLFGCPKAMEIGDAFYKFAVEERGLAKQPALEGVSRGGLFVYNWAARHPDRVSCIYCDVPVCDFKSWPGGKGRGLGSAPTWKQCLSVYGLDEDQALEYEKNPIDHAEVLAAAKIPLLHVVTENDRVVPPTENSYVLKKRLADVGHTLEVISVAEGTAKSCGHHFTHNEQQRVINFIKKHGAK
jgi:pimeloyl-ACP methyl ester carboxylesterase